MHCRGPAGSPRSIWPVATIRSLCQSRTGPQLPSVHRLAFLSLTACLLACVAPQAPSSSSCRGCSAISRVSPCCSFLTTLSSTPPLLSNISSGWKWCLVSSRRRASRQNSRSALFSAGGWLAISSQVVATDPKKTEAVANWRCPSHVSERCSFLSFPSWQVPCIGWWVSWQAQSQRRGQVRLWMLHGHLSVERALRL